MTKCNFAFSGTYGHECGKPATKVASFASKLTKSGNFFAGRCDECAKVKGGENYGMVCLEVVDETKHVNEWL